MSANGRNHGGAGRTIGEIYKDEPPVPPNTRQVLDTHTVDKGGVVTLRQREISEQVARLPHVAEQTMREMDRDDRRLIFGEIDTAYRDAEHGYKPGNSDAAIADSLGVPVLWVRNVREEMFGPADGNKATKKLIELRSRLDAIDPEITKAAATVAELMKEAQAIRMDLNTLQRKE